MGLVRKPINVLPPICVLKLQKRAARVISDADNQASIVKPIK